MREIDQASGTVGTSPCWTCKIKNTCAKKDEKVFYAGRWRVKHEVIIYCRDCEERG